MTISNNASALRPGVCTSSTRPVTPYEGQVIYETDTDRTLVYNGTSWVLLHSASSFSSAGVSVYPNFMVYLSGANGAATDGVTLAYNATLYDDTSSVSSGVFTVPAGHAGIYQFNVNANCYNIGTSGLFRIILMIGGSNTIDIQGSQVPASGSTDVFSVATTNIKLAVGDTVRARWRVPANGNYSAGITYNNFSGTRIR